MTDHDATLRNRIEAWAAELDNRTRDKSARLAPDEVAARLRALAATVPDTRTEHPGQPVGKNEGLDDAGPVSCCRSPRRQDPAQPDAASAEQSAVPHIPLGWGHTDADRTADVEALGDWWRTFDGPAYPTGAEFAEALLASGWLAEHDAALVREAKAEGAREALLSAAEVAERHQKDGRCSGRHCHRADAVMLRSRAAEARLADVRALADQWQSLDDNDVDWQQAINDLHAAIEQGKAGKA